MDRELQSPVSQADLLTLTTSKSFKCSQCGNMYPVTQERCEVCGHSCTSESCRVVEASNEGY
jgi:predicted amidophosphoribosyltransferase